MKRCAFGLLAAAAFLAPARAQTQSALLAEPQEIFLDLRYEVALRTVITGRLTGDTLYLPLGELLDHLQIDRTLWPARASAAGFYINPKRHYEIRGDSGFARLGEETFALAASDVIATDLDVYVRPAVLERLFDWSFIIDYQQLTMRLHAPEPLPVLEEYRRERRRAALAADSAEAAPDLRFPRQRHWLHGGVVQYGLSGIIAQNDGAVLDLAAGVEVLGGDLQLNLHTALDSSRITIPETGGFWRYVVDGRPWLTQIVAGEMLFDGAQLHDLAGARISNAPVQPRRLFGRDSIRGSTEPGWEVELYLNDRLAGYTRADPRGRYSFPLQVAYGSTVAELRHYGPTGQVQIEERRLQLPYSLLPRGRTEYDVAGGRRSAGGVAGIARVAHGLTRWLTLGAGLESLTDVKTPAGPERSIVPLLESGARFGPAILEGKVAPGKSVGTAAELYFGSNTNLGFSWTRFRPDLIYNPSALREVGEAHAFLPFDVGVFPLNLRMLADTRVDEDGRVFSADLDASMSLPGWRPTMGYELNLGTTTGETAASRNMLSLGSYFYPARRFLAGPLAGVILHAELGVDLESSSVARIDAGLSAQVGPLSRVAFSMTHASGLGPSQFMLRYTLHHDALRSVSSARVQGGRADFTQSVRGSVGYDAGNRAVIFTDREWVGRAGAAVRFFHDRNDNGVYDAGEDVIEGGRLEVSDALAARPSSGGLLRTPDLLSYQRYSARVNTTLLPNPLLLPRYRSFAFDTEPNAYKRIDVPFLIAGVIEGSVVRRIGEASAAVGGIRVRLRSVDGSYEVALTTFSDGSFYHFGVLPGAYDVSIDEEQLSLLRVAAEPGQRRITVRSVEDGDYVGNIDFTLVAATDRR